MTIAELIKDLQQYDGDARVGVVDVLSEDIIHVYKIVDTWNYGYDPFGNITIGINVDNFETFGLEGPAKKQG